MDSNGIKNVSALTTRAADLVPRKLDCNRTKCHIAQLISTFSVVENQHVDKPIQEISASFFQILAVKKSKGA